MNSCDQIIADDISVESIVDCSHKNATVRAEAAKLLAAIVERLGAAKSLSGAKDVTERILPAAAHFVQESSPEARFPPLQFSFGTFYNLDLILYLDWNRMTAARLGRFTLNCVSAGIWVAGADFDTKIWKLAFTIRLYDQVQSAVHRLII